MMNKKQTRKKRNKKRNTRKKMIKGGGDNCSIYRESENKYKITKPNPFFIKLFSKNVSFDFGNYNYYFDTRDLIGEGGFGKVYLCTENKNIFNPLNYCQKPKISMKKIIINENISKEKIEKKRKEIEKEIDILKIIKKNEELKKYGLEYEFDCHLDNKVEYFIFAELLDMDLNKYIVSTDTKIYNISNTAYICDKLLRGLQAFHNAKLYHKDIKPENIMITIDKINKIDKVKYVDFGLSCNNEEYLCDRGGTRRYLCPLYSEKLNSEKLQKIDRFALGMTFFKLLTKKDYLDYNYDNLYFVKKFKLIDKLLDIKTRLNKSRFDKQELDEIESELNEIELDEINYKIQLNISKSNRMTNEEDKQKFEEANDDLMKIRDEIVVNEFENNLYTINSIKIKDKEENIKEYNKNILNFFNNDLLDHYNIYFPNKFEEENKIIKYIKEKSFCYLQFHKLIDFKNQELPILCSGSKVSTMTKESKQKTKNSLVNINTTNTRRDDRSVAPFMINDIDDIDLIPAESLQKTIPKRNLLNFLKINDK